VENSQQILVFGAGSIGRGLIGQLAAHAGWCPVFVEPVAALRRQLQEQGQFQVRLTGRQPETYTVCDFAVLAPQETDVLTAALKACVFAVTAVGGTHLKSAAQCLAGALHGRREKLPLLLCENFANADRAMAGYLREFGVNEDAVSCVPSSVERMVRPGEDLMLVGESCETLLVDGSKWPSPKPAIEGLQFVEDIEPYYKRKLYTNNGGHALLAYRGALSGYTLLNEGMDDAGIRKDLSDFLGVAASALAQEFGMDQAALDDHIESLMRHRFPNRELADTVKRVGREPLRKLGSQERLLGLLHLVQKHHLDLAPVCGVIAAAMHYDDPDDAECVRMKQMMADGGAERVLRDVCGLGPDDAAYAHVLKFYAGFQPK